MGFDGGLYFVDDGQYGSVVNGKMNGMVGDVVKGVRQNEAAELPLYSYRILFKL